MYNGTPKELNHYDANDALQAWLADPSINPYVQAQSGENEAESSSGGGSVREQVAAQMRTPTRASSNGRGNRLRQRRCVVCTKSKVKSGLDESTVWET